MLTLKLKADKSFKCSLYVLFHKFSELLNTFQFKKVVYSMLKLKDGTFKHNFQTLARLLEFSTLIIFGQKIPLARLFH